MEWVQTKGRIRSNEAMINRSNLSGYYHYFYWPAKKPCSAEIPAVSADITTGDIITLHGRTQMSLVALQYTRAVRSENVITAKTVCTFSEMKTENAISGLYRKLETGSPPCRIG
jgi:hypothetical protein